MAGNTSKISSIVAAFCILIYIAAIAFGATRIILDIGERRNLAEREFFDLADRASSSAVFLGFMTEAYQESIRDFFVTSSILLGVIITGPGNEHAFERHPGSGIAWTGNAPRLRAGAGIPREPFFMPLRVEGQRNVTIQATYSFIDYGLFQRVLRDTLLAVMGALIIAFVTLLVEFSNNKKKAGYRGKTASRPVRVPEVDEEPLFAEEDEHMFDEIEAETQSSRTRTAESSQSLNSSRNNTGWESQIQERLTSELHRCSSFEQDLTFMVMEFSETTFARRQLADEAEAFFYMRDLIFEQGDNGISIIFPNISLDEGIKKAEEFRSHMAEKLPELFEGHSGLCIGLSSRAGRLVEAKRILLEAFSALEKALKDKVSHVVAFKSDPEKYREFIRQNNRNG